MSPRARTGYSVSLTRGELNTLRRTLAFGRALPALPLPQRAALLGKLAAATLAVKATKRTLTRARARHERDGEVEIDDGAIESRGDDGGAYVQAWVWVPDHD